jgi:hypothetical protein
MELCQKAMTMAVAHPESANQSASWLLNNSRHLLSKLQEGFASTSNGADIHDEVVLAALSCHNIYGQATGNVQGCLEIAELILPFASCHAVRSKVEEQINFAHWYLEQDKSSKTTGQRSASEQYRSLQTEATGAEYSETTAENVHESSAPVQAVRYSIKYSESDGAQTLRAQITSILNAPEPPEQKFFSLVDTILPLISEISRVSGQHSAESREASDSAVSSFRDIAAELFMELRTRQLAYEALKLAADLCFDPELKKDIENERVIIEQYGAEMNLLKEDLHKISRPPVLRSFGGAGLVLAGASDFDSKGVSHLTTLYLSLFFIRLLPLARYRVIRRKDGSVTFIGKAKLRRIDQLHILLVIAMVLTLVLVFFWEV